jgi:hypothetical protein
LFLFLFLFLFFLCIFFVLVINMTELLVTDIAANKQPFGASLTVIVSPKGLVAEEMVRCKVFGYLRVAEKWEPVRVHCRVCGRH